MTKCTGFHFSPVVFKLSIESKYFEYYWYYAATCKIICPQLEITNIKRMTHVCYCVNAFMLHFQIISLQVSMQFFMIRPSFPIL